MAASISDLDPHVSAPGAQLIFHLLLGRVSIHNAMAFSKILEKYCQASGLRVNLLKSAILFSLKTKIQLRHAIG